MNKLLAIGLFVTFTSIIACQEVTEGLLIADYKIRYKEQGNELEIQAKYKTFIPEVSEEVFLPADGVDVFEKPMEYKSMQGHSDDYYSFKERLPFSEVIKFRFKNQAKELIEQTATFKPLKKLSIDRTAIDRDSGFYFLWENDTLALKDELRIIFDYDKGETVRMNLVGGSSTNKLFLRKEQLVALKAGKVKVSLVQRSYQRYPNGGAVLGSYMVEYYYRPIYIEVK